MAIAGALSFLGFGILPCYEFFSKKVKKVKKGKIGIFECALFNKTVISDKINSHDKLFRKRYVLFLSKCFSLRNRVEK